MKVFLSILLGTVLFVLLVGAAIGGWQSEENARGAREWKDTRAHLQATGQSTDYSQLIPPPVPDAQNLAAIPLFRLEPISSGGRMVEAGPLENALQNVEGEHAPPSFGNFSKSERMDRTKLEAFLADRYKKVFPGRSGSPTALQEFDALCPALADLHQAAGTRPSCRFQRDYTSDPSYARPLDGVTSLIVLSHVLNLHAVVALQANQPDVALADIETALKIDDGIRREPILLSGLVAVGVMAIQLEGVWEGLDRQAWTDAQLSALQERLAQVDFLADAQSCLRGEALGQLAPMMDYFRDSRADLLSLVFGSAGVREKSWGTPVIASLTPRGWFDMTKARGVTLDFDAAMAVDPVKRRVNPRWADKVHDQAAHAGGFSIPGILLRTASPPIVGATAKFCEAQARVDFARIACMLERYRLAHGTYPETLELLAPSIEQGMPNDPITGEPYRYRRQPGGTYLLYSVGWNQVDDGGTVAYLPDNPRQVDSKRGDWVWPKPTGAAK